MTGIYKITNKINGKSYIGQSINIKKRWENHKCMNGNKEYPIYRAFRKYGVENFKFEVLEECEVEELAERELYYILYYESYGKGYNQTLSTTNPLLDPEIMEKAITNMKANHKTEEYRELQRKITTELWQNDSYRSNVMESLQTDEVKEKLSKNSKRVWKVKRKEMLKAIRDAAKTPELRAIRSKNQKERYANDAEYRKLNNKNLDKARQVYIDKMENDEEFRRKYIKNSREAAKPRMKSISMLDKETRKELKEFESLAAATRWIQSNAGYPKADYSTIRKSSMSDTRSAYGYRWKLHESVETIRKE